MSIRIGIGLDVFGAGIDADATTIYNRIIADGGVSNLTRLNFFVKGLKAIYGDLANVPVCYDAHWIGYKLGSGTGATSGQAAAKLYSLTVAGDAVQSTAASQPLLLAHNGASSANYYQGVGVSGNYVSTPNAAANRISGDIEIIAKIDYKTNSTYQFIVSTYDTGGYSLAIAGSTNLIYFEAKVGASVFGITSTQNFPTTFNGYLKLTRTTSDGIVKFFTSNDGIAYTQLGANVATTAGNLVTGTAPLKIGENFNTSYPFQSKISRLTISNSIGGTPVVDFNPATYNASTSQTAWTSSTGEVWTINTGTATTGYKGVLVDRMIVQSDGVDDRLTSGTLASRTTYTRYLAITPLNTGTQYVFAGSGAVNHLNYKKATNTFLLYNGAAEIILTSIFPYLKQLFTSDLNGSSSIMRLNNGSDSTANLSVTASTSVTFGADGVGTLFANSILETVIETNSVDTNTTKTATYNLIRSLNNNAF